METVGDRIKIAADRIGGLDRLAERLPDVKRRTLTDYVSGKSEPRASFLRDLCVATQVDPGWLVTGAGVAQVTPADGVAMITDPPNRFPERGASFVDTVLLEHAIALIERGLEEAGRTASPSVKAGMISAAYEILTDAKGEVAEGRILRLVKG